MKNRKKTTFDRIMSDAEQKKKFEKEYAQFLFSELLLEAMKEEHVSVRELAEKSGGFASIILCYSEYAINEADEYYHKDYCSNFARIV